MAQAESIGGKIGTIGGWRARAAGVGRFAPAALQWATAVLFLVAWPQFPSAFAVHLAKLMELEFLALHAGAFVGLLVIWHPHRLGQRIARWAGIIGFGAVYLLGGYQILGWTGVVELGAMMFATYSGLLFGAPGGRGRLAMEVGARWFISFVIFMLLSGVLGTPQDVGTWHEVRITLPYGALYFAALGGMELSGLYRWIRSGFEPFGTSRRPRRAR